MMLSLLHVKAKNTNNVLSKAVRGFMNLKPFSSINNINNKNDSSKDKFVYSSNPLYSTKFQRNYSSKLVNEQPHV